MTSDALDHRPWPVAGPATRWWPLALLAIVAPTLLAAHDPPSVTFYNQALAVLGWGLFLAMLSSTPLPAGIRPGRATWALAGVLALQAALAAWSSAGGLLPAGLGMMGAGLCLAALLAVLGGWRAGRGPAQHGVADVFFGALAVAGVIGMVLAVIQVFHPAWADGRLIATPSVAGRAVGNLRQPNHFSTLLVWCCCAVIWLGQRRRLPESASAALVALFIGGGVDGLAHRHGWHGFPVPVGPAGSQPAAQAARGPHGRTGAVCRMVGCDVAVVARRWQHRLCR